MKKILGAPDVSKVLHQVFDAITHLDGWMGDDFW